MFAVFETILGVLLLQVYHGLGQTAGGKLEMTEDLAEQKINDQMLSLLETPQYYTQGKYGSSSGLRGKIPETHGGKVMLSSVEYSENPQEERDNSFTYEFKGKRETEDISIRAPEKEFREDLKAAPVMSVGLPSREDFHEMATRIFGSSFKSAISSTTKPELKANTDLCIRFFFSVQEMPRYFAGVTDALLNATKTGLPLAESMMSCSHNASFMDTLSCIRGMEPDIKKYYISLVPVFKSPLLAFHQQFVKVKEELDGCLEIKTISEGTISYTYQEY